METLIVIKEATVRGTYEEPIWDNAPMYTYTKDVAHRLYPGEIYYIDCDGGISHKSHEYGVSMNQGTLTLYPTEAEKKSLFGKITEYTAKPWNRILKKKSEIDEKLKILNSELSTLEKEMEYYLDEENEDVSLDDAWLALTKKNKLEYERMCLEFRYSGIYMSMRLLHHTLECYSCEESFE